MFKNYNALMTARQRIMMFKNYNAVMTARQRITMFKNYNASNDCKTKNYDV